MELLSDKHKEYLDKDLKIEDLSFTYGVTDLEPNILFYLHCRGTKKENKGNHFIDILDICVDTKSIIFNYVLTEEQIKELLRLVTKLTLNKNVSKNITDGIYKIIALMCIEYNYKQIKFEDYLDECIVANNEVFDEIVKSLDEYFKVNKIKTSIDEKDFNYDYSFDDFEISEENALEEYATNLTTYDYKYDPAIGREDEIKSALVSLMQNSCVLVGESGVGKTAIAEGIAYRIKKGLVPQGLKDKQLYEITASDIVSGCRYVGDMEEKLTEILGEVVSRENVILFFDEIHTAIGTGRGSEGTLDIANILKPYIDRGQIKIIGATTNSEYDEYIGKDPAFKRRFEKITVKEPKNDSLYEIIDNTINNLSKASGVKFNNKKINKERLINELIEITGKSHRNYIDIEYNPGLVISILKKSFGFAMYYEHKELEISDIVESVDKCDYLYQPVRNKLNKTVEPKTKKKVIEKNNIITFPSNK